MEKEGNEAVIRVRDNGIGIAQEHIPGLFEMFAQVDTSLERSRGGLGIGLTLVKTLVEMHGGTVRGAERRARRAEANSPSVSRFSSDAARPASRRRCL